MKRNITPFKKTKASFLEFFDILAPNRNKDATYPPPPPGLTFPQMSSRVAPD